MDSLYKKIFNATYIEQAAIEEITGNLKLRSYRKGDFLLKEEETCRHIYFLKKGLVKLFFTNGDREFIVTFFQENNWFSELSSLYTGKPEKFMMIALEPVEVYCFDKDVVDSFCAKYRTVDAFFRRLYAKGPYDIMNRFSEMLEGDGRKKYEDFLSKRSDLIQRISLGDLASYIGVTQVSLSRIRAQK